MSVGKIAILILSTVFVAGCGSSSKSAKLSCEQKDWYELGRHDGAQGATPDRISEYKKDCNDGFNAFWETMYSNGRNAGLVEFCHPENSFELGRMGITYRYVCPSTMEPDFLAGYRNGQKARQIEIENQKLDAAIDAMVAKIARADSTYEKRQLASELQDLKKERAKNERELPKN